MLIVCYDIFLVLFNLEYLIYDYIVMQSWVIEQIFLVGDYLLFGFFDVVMCSGCRVVEGVLECFNFYYVEK